MMKKLILTALLLTVALGVCAQHTISGTVTDSRSGETLIGATIYDTISRKGTITNQHGRYSLTLKGDKAVIRISFVGCETQFHTLALDANQRLDAKLQSTHTLQEVKVVGYADVNLAKMTTPQMTTIRQPVTEMAREAIRVIEKAAHHESYPVRTMFHVTLERRGTT